MIVLTEKTSIISKSIMFWILVFSCPKMTLITIFTRMTHCTFFAYLFGVSHIRQKVFYKIKISPESQRSSHWTWQTQFRRPKIPEELKLYHVKAIYFVDNMITRHFSSFTVTCKRVLCVSVTFEIRT